MRMNIPFRRVGRVGIGLCEIVVQKPVSLALTVAGHCKIYFQNTGEGFLCLSLSCSSLLLFGICLYTIELSV